MHTLAFVATLLFSLVMGVLWGTWLSLARSMHTSPADMVLATGKTMIGNLASPMRLLMISTLASTVALEIVLLYRQDAASLLSALVGLACMIGILVITLTVNVPIDKQINSWKLQTLPKDWQDIIKRWQKYHAARTGLSVLGFAAMLLACVLL